MLSQFEKKDLIHRALYLETIGRERVFVKVVVANDIYV